MTVVRVDCDRIADWESFHAVFAEAFGFPSFYGRNMNAWIDCMTSLDEPADGMTAVHAPPGGVLVLDLAGVSGFARRCPEQYDAVVECAAFVNWRRLQVGERAAAAEPGVEPRGSHSWAGGWSGRRPNFALEPTSRAPTGGSPRHPGAACGSTPGSAAEDERRGSQRQKLAAVVRRILFSKPGDR